MMKFLLGVVIGAVGVWAYQNGKLQSLIGEKRLDQVVDNDQIRQVASSVTDRVQQATGPRISMPSAAEVASRPSEPLPRQEPEGIHGQNG
jgi:hypothetical protein